MKSYKSQLARLQALSTEIRTLPEVTIRLGDDPTGRRLYASFTKPHARYRVVQSKRWGAALVSLNDGFAAYLQGKRKQAVRTNRNRAMAEGFSFATVDAFDHMDALHEVNASIHERQGLPMAEEYLDPEQLSEFFRSRRQIYGVLDGSGTLKAYASVEVSGELSIITRLLGHAEFLDIGIMYLLVSEVIREMFDDPRKPAWIMYDMMLGAGSGLRYFKERLGFAPYKVRWRLGSEAFQ